MDASLEPYVRKFVSTLGSKRRYRRAATDLYVFTERDDGHPFGRVLSRPHDLVWGHTASGPRYEWELGVEPDIRDVHEEWDRLVGPVLDGAREPGVQAAEEAYLRGGLRELGEHEAVEREGMARDLKDARATVDHAADVIRALALEAAIKNELLPNPDWGTDWRTAMGDIPELMGTLGGDDSCHFAPLTVSSASLYSFARRLHRGVMWGEGAGFVGDALCQLYAVYGLDCCLVIAQHSGLHGLESEVRAHRDSFLRRSAAVRAASSLALDRPRATAVASRARDLKATEPKMETASPERDGVTIEPSRFTHDEFAEQVVRAHFAEGRTWTDAYETVERRASGSGGSPFTDFLLFDHSAAKKKAAKGYRPASDDAPNAVG
ncbi:hypothetical protein [Rubrivirga marina]|uniref:Uncharacterized protein n=1 Tax=Rubrivirga marina TaxID=1196024 RepID=A0A271IXN5_9BACT|nr:hypothetical protein [Rubrivirga marina]PAP75289.1 hypothetical protein BSZ37_01940 [Rubrivirga marina]